MPEGYQQIPDWFSFENEGGGIAVASISGASTQDLLIAAVDSPEGQNRGVYRIGRKVDGDGQVTGGWSPWRDVPDWFSHNNAGVAAVVADIDGDSKPDLVLFMIDAPTEQNQGYYRIGKALDSDGNLTGGWGPWIPIPDWFSWENQHGAIAVADLDGDGRLELIVLMVDNPPGKNRGVYRIGRALDAGGQVTGGWTPWIDVPDWFSWENQGAGITVIDRGMAAKDLVVLMVDNPIGQNQAFYKIGKDVNIDGTPVGGWSEWLGVPGWFSWENQGAGIAVMPSNGTPAMSVMLVDNPPGQNEGRYRVLPLDVNPERDGEWELLQYDSQVLAVHAALLPTGSVLFFAGSGSSKARFESPEFPHLPISVVWDPNAPVGSNFSTPPILLSADGRPYDSICGGDTFLSDGKLLSAGGTATYPFSGRREAATFDPKTKQWGFVAQMDRGRWYPTLLTLGDGRVLAASDLEEKNTLEIYSPKTNTWTTSTFAPGFAGLPLYAHLFLMANGKICFTGGRMDDLMEVAPCIFDLAHNPVSTVQIPNGTQGGMRNQSASVLLPPAQDQRVMIMGAVHHSKRTRRTRSTMWTLWTSVLSSRISCRQAP